MLGVYVHIPFCDGKCSYCGFSSFVKTDDEKERYINSLVEEIKEFAGEKKREIDSIYIGGGTPSILPINLICKLFEALKENFKWKDGLEFTIEANPCSLDEEKLSFYKKNGVNRISLGVQSLDENQLKFIGRRHSSIEAIDAVKLAKKYFDNVSCDLLIGLKDMDENAFLAQINTLAELGITHISAYMLQVEEGTRLHRLVEKNKHLLPTDDDCVDVYEKMTDKLAILGFSQYEISNFAKQGYESYHNFKHWTGQEYVGFGLGAHSYLNGKRIANDTTFSGYYDRIHTIEAINDQQRLEEHIMLGLRCKAGISKIVMKTLGYDITTNSNLVEFVEKGILNQQGDIITLNPDYYGVSNYIFVKLLPE